MTHEALEGCPVPVTLAGDCLLAGHTLKGFEHHGDCHCPGCDPNLNDPHNQEEYDDGSAR